MARDILGEYGPDTHKVQQPRITKNGPAGSLHSDTDYHPPQGPRQMMNTGVGLRGGYNYGNQGTQGAYGGVPCNSQVSGSPSSGTASGSRRPAGSQHSSPERKYGRDQI